MNFHCLYESNEKELSIYKIFNFKKGLLVAAIIVLLITIAIPVGADVLNIDVPESILKVYEEYFRLDTEGEATSDDLDTLLAKNDLHDIVLPRFLFLDCEISDFKKTGEELIERVDFKYFAKDENIIGIVTFNTASENGDFLEGKTHINSQYEEAEELSVNGIQVVVFNENGKNLIVYQVNGMEYTVELNNITFDKAIEIASTL